MQDHATDQLNVEVTHVENTPPRFTNYSKTFHQDLVENLVEGLPALVF